MLEIALCAQHMNGGVAVDVWWQSSVTGLFAAGDCTGTPYQYMKAAGEGLIAAQAACSYVDRLK